MADLFPRSRPASTRRRAARSFDDLDRKPKADGSLFGWTVFLLLLVGLVAVCWMGTLYVFGHPEEPLGYSILHKFKKLEAPKRFSETAAPRGEFLDAKKLLDRYGPMTPRQLQKESDQLLRAYIQNYAGNLSLVPYVTGRFDILDSYQLTKSDFFPSGVVVLAQDSDVPQVLIEEVFPAIENVVPQLHRTLLTGIKITIQRSLDLAPIIHVERLPDGRLKFTTIPIQYPDYSSTQGVGSFSLEPPRTLNVEAGLPILSKGKVAEADARFAGHRRKLANPGGAPSASNELLPVRPAVSTSGQMPSPPVVRAEPAAPAGSVPLPATTPPVLGPDGSAGEPKVARAIPVDGSAPPAGSSPQEVGTDVALKPFNGANSAVATTTSGKWPTYKPNQMPRGRLVGMKTARELTPTELTGQRMYLRGDFTVTAAVGNSAVMRSAASDPDGAPNTRIVVQYPANSQSPQQGATVSRGADRPFLVTNVRKSADGQVNIYVREVTTAE